jgi:hypothetical protein
MYLVWEIYAGAALRHFAQMTLLALMCALLTPSTISALHDAKARRRVVDAIDQDLMEGVPISVFVNRYNGSNFIFPPAHPPLYNDPPISNDMARRMLTILQRANVGKFRYLRLDYPLRELSLPVVPIEHNEMKWDEGVGQGTGIDPNLVFALTRPMYLYGIRLRLVVQHSKKTARIRVSWKRSAKNEFTMAERNFLVNVETGKENTTIIPVHDVIDRYRIGLEDPTSAIKISEIQSVLPPPALVNRR